MPSPSGNAPQGKRDALGRKCKGMWILSSIQIKRVQSAVLKIQRLCGFLR
jgi:hypothetical protein